MEPLVKKLTGQAMVPVLITGDDKVDSGSRARFWTGLRKRDRSRRCCPNLAERARETATLWEEVALNALGPHGRVMITGRLLRIDDPEAQKSGKYFAEKYGYSPFEEEQSRLTVTKILTSLQETLSGREYLVGDTFTLRRPQHLALMLMLVQGGSAGSVSSFSRQCGWFTSTSSAKIQRSPRYSPGATACTRTIRERGGQAVASADLADAAAPNVTPKIPLAPDSALNAGILFPPSVRSAARSIRLPRSSAAIAA